MGWLQHIGGNGRGKPLPVLAKLKENWLTLIKQGDKDEAEPAAKSPQPGGEVCVKVYPARFGRKGVKVKLHVRGGGSPTQGSAPASPVRAPEEHVRLHILSSRFGRRAVRVRLVVEEDQSGPVKLQLAHALFGDRVKVHLRVDEEAAPVKRPPKQAASHRDGPSGPVSIKLAQNWRGRVKLHAAVAEPGDADKLVRLQLHPQLLTKKVVAKLHVL